MILKSAATVRFLKFGQLPKPAEPTVYQIRSDRVKPDGRHRFDPRAGRPVLGHPGREYGALGIRRHLTKLAFAFPLAGAVGVLCWLYVHFG